MTKRAAGRQITKDDAHNEDDDDNNNSAEEGGGEEEVGRASDDVLAERRIVKVKRNDDGTWKRPPSVPNPFANVRLVTTAPATAAGAAATTTAATVVNGASKQGVAAPAESEQATADPGDSIAPESPGDEPKKSQKVDNDGPPAKTPSIFGATAGFSGFGSVVSTDGGSTGFAGFGDGTLAAPPGEKGPLAFGAFGGASSFGGFADAAIKSSSSLAFGRTASSTTAGAAATETEGTADGADAPVPPASAAGTDGSGLANAPTTTKPSLVALPTDYELVSGEEHEETLLELRSRTYRWGLQPTASAPDLATQASAAATLSVPPSSSSSFREQPDPEHAATPTANESSSSSSSSSTSAPFAWLEAGVGPLRILRHTTTGAMRLVQRRESTPNGPATKVLWNVPLWRESTMQLVGDKHVRVSTLAPHATVLLCKCAAASQATDLLRLLKDRVPHLKSAFAQTPAVAPGGASDDSAPTGPEPPTTRRESTGDKAESPSPNNNNNNGGAVSEGDSAGAS